MRGKRNWWTVQFVPHGKGNVQSYKVKLFPIFFVLSMFLVLFISGIGVSYYFWNVTKDMDSRIHEQLDEIHEYKTENNELKVNISSLNHELSILHNEVNSLQEWLKEVQLLEQKLRDLEDISSVNDGFGLDTPKPLTLRLSTYIEDPYGETIEFEKYTDTIDDLRSKISQLREDAEVQQSQLTQLKEQIEEEQYLAQFIPSIPPSKGRVSSPFGYRRDPFHGRTRMHEGIDFVDSFRSPIYATAKGKVAFAGRNGGYGNQIIIDHGNGYKTTYSHLTTYSVNKGDEVEKGEVIGRMGSTGRSTGVHLHYEIHKEGKPINPSSYIKGGL